MSVGVSDHLIATLGGQPDGCVVVSFLDADDPCVPDSLYWVFKSADRIALAAVAAPSEEAPF